MTAIPPAIYLCPSDRAARAFERRLARKSLAPTPCIDFERFCVDLWRRSQLFGLIAESRELVDNEASLALWQALVLDETALMASETTRVASLLDEAWTIANRYALPLRQISSLASGQDNVALFARCAARMQALIQRVGAITQSEIYAQLLQQLDNIESLLPKSVVLTPSFTVHAGQRRLLEAFVARGIAVTLLKPEGRPMHLCRAYEFANESQEMRTVIAWAKSRAADGDKVIAIIVPNLSQHRAQWLTALREQLNPDRWRLDPETDRAQFNLSIGEPVATCPWVACLITVLGATVGNIETEVLAQALIHPRWGRAPHSLQRVQRQLWKLLKRGTDQCSLRDWLDVLPSTVPPMLHETANAKKQARTSHHATLLTLVAALTEHPSIAKTDMFQLEVAWLKLLRRWVLMDRWLSPVSWRGAVSEIARMAVQQTFQPQSGGARIQVMGLLESAGVPLDAAWIVGLTDRVLPEAYKPHPMLPRAWQSLEQVGLGSRDEVRRRADALWANWNLLCDELHVSHARDFEGSPQRISPLAAGVTRQTLPAVEMIPSTMLDLMVVSTCDELLPDVAAQSNRKPLTAGLLEQQANCPRKAAASRLNMREWPEHAVGIPARLRGQIVHDVMHAVGDARIQQTRDNGDEPTIELLRHIASEALSVAVQHAKLDRPGIPAAVWEIERERLLPLIDKVLQLDAARQGFAVVAVEQELITEVLGGAFKLRPDRRDLYTGAAGDSERFGVVFDYKTGNVSRADWFSENNSGRLAAPQLPLYLFALHAVLPVDEPRIGAIGYIVISDDAVKFVGVGADESLNPKKISTHEPAWPELTKAWESEISALIDEHRAGVADVAPLEGTATCRFCSFAGFCREPWSLAGVRDEIETEAEHPTSTGEQP